MNATKKNVLTSIVAIIALSLTGAVYALLPYAKEKADILVFACTLGAEILAYINLLFYNCVSDKKRLALAAGGYSVTAVYLVLSVIASLVFGLYYRHALSAYTIIVAVLAALFIIVVILIYVGEKKVIENNNDAETACLFFKNLEYKVESLCANTADEDVAKELKRLRDAIKSCDHSNRVETDTLIKQQVDLLAESLKDTDTMRDVSEKILCLIRQRSTEVCQLKMGGI